MISIEDIKQLKLKYGESFYLVDENEFQRHYNLWKHAFTAVYENTHLAYSYKTNYLPFLCIVNKNLGGFAEVVSDVEYAIASAIGVPNSDIIYNGPMKSINLSANIVMSGGIVNIDSYTEAENLVIEIRKRTAKRVNIGIRCNISDKDRFSRFGVSVNSQEFNDITQLFRRNNIRIGCLHCHAKGRDIDAWKRKTDKMLSVLDSVAPYCADNLCIDLGGSLPALIDNDDAEGIATFYAESVARIFKNRSQQGVCPHLIVEPGTALAAPAMTFVTTAIASKRINNQAYVTLSASSHNLGSSHNRNPKYLRQYPLREREQTTVLCGYTCLEDDIICNYDRRVEVGDTFVFPYVGAYSIVMKPPFIMPNFPVIVYNEKTDNYEIIRESEDIYAFCTEAELKGRK